jgi:hypothetical protein
MAAQTTSLLLPEDLETAGHLAENDRAALMAVSKWIDDYVVRPHAELGRPGTVCPYVPGSLERRTLWFAPEHAADLDGPAVVQLMDDYRRLFLEHAPLDSDDAVYKTILVVFTDLPADRAGALFDQVLTQLAADAYEEHGVIFGPYFDGNEAPAVYNHDFRPFEAPVPFIFVRHTVVDDWKFFIDDDTLLDRWARRFGSAGTIAISKQLRRLPWRSAELKRPPSSSGG